MNRPRQTGREQVTVPDAVRIGAEIHRRLAVAGSGGVEATVLVLVRKGAVWLSIEPRFTWEAVMAPSTVDTLVRTLEIARDEASMMRQHGTRRR